MGISFSGRRNQTPQNHHHHHHHTPYYHHNSAPPPPPPPPYYYHPSPTTTNTSSSSPAFAEPSPVTLLSPQSPPPPPPPQNSYGNVPPTAYPTTHFQYQQTPPSIQSNYYYNNGWSNHYNYPPNPMMGGRPSYGYFPPNYGNGWHQMRHPVPQLQLPPPPYVEHQSAKVVKNDVNVHKDTIKLHVDEHFPDQYLVSFVFDAHFDGSITIYYFAKEEKDTCTFTPAYPEAIRSIKVPFLKGVGQRFQQASGTGVDLGFFDLESLGKPSEDDVFPLVVYAEVCSSQEAGEYLADSSPRAQVTQAIIEKTNVGSYQVKAIRQILWIDGVRYELRDLYGIGNSSSETFNDDEPGKECVICMTEPKNTAVMPCRHLCMCSDCSKELRLQSNKCPICRQPITELIEIKISNTS